MFLVFCLCFQKASYAQTFRLGNVSTLKATAFDKKTKDIYAIWKDSIRVYKAPDYKTSRLLPIAPPHRAYPEAYLPVVVNSTLHFVDKQGGIVYKLRQDSLRRIDRSFNHKMQINSTIFSRNDTIMKYGGYGFWSDRNFFTYFNKESNEWEIVPPIGSDRLPPGSHDTELVQNETHTYIFSGVATNEFNPLNVDEFNEAWRFEWRTNSWEYLGKLHQDFSNYIEVLQMGDKMIYALIHKHQYVLADPANNKLTYYEINASRRGIYSHWPKDNNIRCFYDEGKIFLVKIIPQEPGETRAGELFYTIVDEQEFLADPLYSERMYTTNGLPLKLAGGAGAVMATVLLVFYGRRRYTEWDKVLVTEKSVRYRGKKVSMDPISLKALNVLLRSPGEIQSQEILDVVENPLQSQAHNIRVKNQVIDNLNFRIKALLGLKVDLIESRPSEVDKRIKSYQINSEYFKVR